MVAEFGQVVHGHLHRGVELLEQDSGILNVTLETLGIINAPIPWLTSPDVALIAIILVNIWLGIPFNLTLL
jgi:multiple sugar transport system permease protein